MLHASRPSEKRKQHGVGRGPEPPPTHRSTDQQLTTAPARKHATGQARARPRAGRKAEG